MTGRHRIRALLLSAACVSLLMSGNIANSQRAPLPTMTVAQFTANPAALLTHSRHLTADVEALLVADHSLYTPIVGLLAIATPDQQTDILNGLGKVALSTQVTDRTFAQSIQQAVALTNNQGWIAALAVAIGGVAIGSANGPGGGTSGGGGQTGGGLPSGGTGTTPQFFSSTSTRNLSPNLFTAPTSISNPGSAH